MAYKDRDICYSSTSCFHHPPLSSPPFCLSPSSAISSWQVCDHAHTSTCGVACTCSCSLVSPLAASSVMHNAVYTVMGENTTLSLLSATSFLYSLVPNSPDECARDDDAWRTLRWQSPAKQESSQTTWERELRLYWTITISLAIKLNNQQLRS